MGKAAKKVHRAERAAQALLPTRPCTHCGKPHRRESLWCGQCTSQGRALKAIGGRPETLYPDRAYVRATLRLLLDQEDTGAVAKKRGEYLWLNRAPAPRVAAVQCACGRLKQAGFICDFCFSTSEAGRNVQ